MCWPDTMTDRARYPATRTAAPRMSAPGFDHRRLRTATTTTPPPGCHLAGALAARRASQPRDAIREAGPPRPGPGHGGVLRPPHRDRAHRRGVRAPRLVADRPRLPSLRGHLG